MKVLILFMFSEDGDEYVIFANEDDKAYEAFVNACNSNRDYQIYHKIVLAAAESGVRIGSGSRGDMFGCEILQEKSYE